MKKRLAILIGVVALGILGLLAGCGKKDVGKDIGLDKVNEFYYTVSSSTNPPEYQRYRFYVEDGKYYFYHEKREGDTWPLTEKHITVNGTKELSDEEWKEFFSLIENGTVEKREEDTSTGGKGPFLYLYWDGDKSEIQEFTFASSADETAFEEFCEGLVD